MKKLLHLIFLGAVSASSLAGCYVSDRPAVYAPGPRVWVPGHWQWNGYARVWIPGHWRRA
ncbi:MAG TPA: YXWGXW repeat-containing protein [Kofleriaceae bacterium]|nr:YXWGXW repeat-containing protein [Kofleriaceae bacterium]